MRKAQQGLFDLFSLFITRRKEEKTHSIIQRTLVFVAPISVGSNAESQCESSCFANFHFETFADEKVFVLVAVANTLPAASMA